MEGKGQSQVINLSQFHEPVPRCHMKVLKSRWKAINMGLLTGYGGCPTFQWPWPEVEFVAKHENRNTSLVSLFKANTLSWTSAQLRYNCNWSHQLQSVCVHSQNMLQTCTESPRPGKQNKNREGNKILNIRSTKRKKTNHNRHQLLKCAFVAIWDSGRKIFSMKLSAQNRRMALTIDICWGDGTVRQYPLFSLQSQAERRSHETPTSVKKTAVRLMVWDICSALPTTWLARRSELSHAGEMPGSWLLHLSNTSLVMTVPSLIPDTVLYGLTTTWAIRAYPKHLQFLVWVFSLPECFISLQVSHPAEFTKLSLKDTATLEETSGEIVTDVITIEKQECTMRSSTITAIPLNGSRFCSICLYLEWRKPCKDKGLAL